MSKLFTGDNSLQMQPYRGRTNRVKYLQNFEENICDEDKLKACSYAKDEFNEECFARKFTYNYLTNTSGESFHA